MKTENQVALKETLLADYQPSPFRIIKTELSFDLAAEETLVTNRMQVKRHNSNAAWLQLDGVGLELVSIQKNGKNLSQDQYEVIDSGLKINFPEDSCELVIQNKIYPHLNKSLEGLYQSSTMYCTQCEPQGFRKISYFLDRPDVLSRYHITLRANKKQYPVMLAGGNFVSARDLADGRHETVWEDPFPKPSYLFALVVGDLACHEDKFTTRSGREVVLRIYTDHINAKKTEFAMDALKRAMRWDEERFNLEYDLDIYMIVAVNDFNMGAMENRALNIFNSHYVLASRETATDEDIMGIYGVVGHEYFHNWTGNRVTLRDWFQLSLKEGLTVYRDQEFSSDIESRGIVRIDNTQRVKNMQFSEDAGPMAHPVKPKAYAEINNFYTTTVYEKGAELVRMMANWLGRDGFSKGLQHYLKKFDGSAATTEDFGQSLSEATNVSLQHFRTWYDIPGTPQVTVKTTYDAAKKSFQICLQQDNPKAKELGHKDYLQTIPLNYQLFDSRGQALSKSPEETKDFYQTPDGARVLVLTREKQDFHFTGLSEQPILSLNREFSAPVLLQQERKSSELITLFVAESDPYAKFEAGQQLALDLIHQLYQGADAKSSEFSQALQSYTTAFGKILSGWRQDPTLTAVLIGLPTISQLLQGQQQVDLAKLDAASKTLERQLAQTHAALLINIFEACQQELQRCTWQDGLRFRAMKNASLLLLTGGGSAKAWELCNQAYQSATNMTEEYGAFNLLMHQPAGSLREKAKQQFFERWQADYLVTNKWFIAQAASHADDAFQGIQNLLKHPDFHLDNPNRCRSLLSAFVRSNLIQYHTHAPQTYKLYAEQILKIDRFNPQLASGLSKVAFTDYAFLSDSNKKLLRQTLETMNQDQAMSKDLREIISRTLKFL